MMLITRLLPTVLTWARRTPGRFDAIELNEPVTPVVVVATVHVVPKVGVYRKLAA